MRTFHKRLCRCACGVMHFTELAGADLDNAPSTIDCPDCQDKRINNLPVRRLKHEISRYKRQAVC